MQEPFKINLHKLNIIIIIIITIIVIMLNICTVTGDSAFNPEQAHGVNFVGYN